MSERIIMCGCKWNQPLEGPFHDPSCRLYSVTTSLHQVTATSDHSKRPADSAAAVATDALAPVERGPWRVTTGSDGRAHVISDDFHHDVYLKVSGDFATPEQQRRYCEMLVGQLNAALSSSAGASTPPVQRDAQVNAGDADLISRLEKLRGWLVVSTIYADYAPWVATAIERLRSRG